MKPCFNSWIASSLMLLAMTGVLDCFVADTPRNDGLGKNWIASELTLFAMTGEANASSNEALLKKNINY